MYNIKTHIIPITFSFNCMLIRKCKRTCSLSGHQIGNLYLLRTQSTYPFRHRNATSRKHSFGSCQELKGVHTQTGNNLNVQQQHED